MQETLDSYIGGKYLTTSFRVLVSEIPSTTYATHGIYFYPAKFIPQVVRFFLEKYGGGTVFDPFAGSGTVGVECEIIGKNYVLWELNPIMDVIIKASTYRGEVKPEELKIDWGYKETFLPNWKNLEYWYPKEFLSFLSTAWGYYHYAVKEELKPLIAIPLMKLSKYFSYADIKFPKLFKSKEAEQRVSRLLSEDYIRIMEEMYLEEVSKLVKKISEFNNIRAKNEVKKIVRSGIDSINEKLGTEVDSLLTSPPYLQAQEYIRTSKLELFWLGHTEEEVRQLMKKEIPYNSVEDDLIQSRLYVQYLNEIKGLKHKGLLKIYSTYFNSLAKFLNNNHEKVINFIGIFVGPVKIRGMRIPIDEILREHLESLGWSHEATYIDQIVSRRLSKVEVNPATKMPDERTPTEHLLIMRRKK